MSGHEAWHVVVLATTLLSLAGVAIVMLGPLVFDPPPPGLLRARPAVLVVALVAGALFLVEWLGVH